MNHNDLELICEIMQTVVQSAAWLDVQSKHPGIAKAESQWYAAFERAKSLLPRDIANELEDAKNEEIVATEDVGILFGIRIANLIRNIAESPVFLSQYI